MFLFDILRWFYYRFPRRWRFSPALATSLGAPRSAPPSSPSPSRLGSIPGEHPYKAKKSIFVAATLTCFCITHFFLRRRRVVERVEHRPLRVQELLVVARPQQVHHRPHRGVVIIPVAAAFGPRVFQDSGRSVKDAHLYIAHFLCCCLL